MDPLSITASLIAVLQVSGTVISALYEYRNGVRSASTDATRIITELNSLRGILESLLQAVEQEAAAASQTSSDGPSSSGGGSRLANFQALTQPNGELERCLADLEAVGAKLGVDDGASLSGWRKARRALMWPFEQKDVEKLLQSVGNAKSTMRLALAADQMAMTLEIHSDVSSLAERFAVSGLDRQRRRIRDWLAAPDPFPNHVAARKKRQPLTGEWFLNGEMYRSWKSAPGSFLWLYGIPGAGKSVLCSSIIEDLLVRQADGLLAVAFYYFDFNDIKGGDTVSLVRALIAQLLFKLPTTASFLDILLSQIDNKQPDVDFLLKTMQSFVLELDQIYIIIDALDECKECEELMNLIETIHKWGNERIHILVTSRQLPEIEEVLSGCATSSICLHSSSKKDIDILIQGRLSSDRKLQKWPPQVRREIYKALTVKASGMFRWVACQLDMLRNCVSLPALRKALESLPKTLDETYERILTSIDEVYASDVRKLLQFMTFSPRAMSLAELVEVFAVDMEAKPPLFDPDLRIPNPMDILTMCSTLVTSAESIHHPTASRGVADTLVDLFPDRPANTSLTVKLAHSSVKEYLLSERIKSSKASMYSIDFISGNLFIAQLYLVYLLSPSFAEGHCYKKELKTRFTNFPLFRAACHLFPFHIGTVDAGANPSISADLVDAATKQLVRALFSTRQNPNGGNYAAWIGGLIPEAHTATIINTPPLYYAASFGMTSIVRMLLAETPRSEVDIKGGRAHATALHVACFRAQVASAELLLEAGADPKSVNCRGESCIYWARDSTSPDYQCINDFLLIRYRAAEIGTHPTTSGVVTPVGAGDGIEYTLEDMLKGEYRE